MGNKHFTKEVIALGKLPYVDKVQLRGRNSAISNSVETVWQNGSTYAQLLSGVAMEVVSSSANDAAAGTGARTVEVKGIDGNYDAFTEIITMNGTTPVPLVNTSAIAINSLKVLTAGSGLTNAGTINCRVVSGAVSKCTIETTTGARARSFDFVYTIPDNFIGLLSSISFSGTGVTGDLSAYLLTRDSAGLSIYEAGGKSSLYNTGFNAAQGIIDLGTGLLIPEKTQLELQAFVSAGAGDLVAQAELLLFDVKNCGLF